MKSIILPKLLPKPSILFFGTDNFSLSILKSLANYNISLIHPDIKCSTKLHANLNNIKTYPISSNINFNMSNYVPTFNNYDIGIIASFGYLVPNSIISKFKYGVINIHPSLLPKYRGSSPIQVLFYYIYIIVFYILVCTSRRGFIYRHIDTSYK